MLPTYNGTEYEQPFQMGGNRIQQGNSGPKQDPDSAGQTPNLVVPYLKSKGLNGSAPPAWLPVTSISSLGLVLLPVCDSALQISRSSGIPNTLASPTQLGLHFHSCNLLEILAFSGSHPGTGLPHTAWHPQFSLTMEEDSTAP